MFDLWQDATGQESLNILRCQPVGSLAGSGAIVDLLPNKEPRRFARQGTPVFSLDVDATDGAAVVVRIHAHIVSV